MRPWKAMTRKSRKISSSPLRSVKTKTGFHSRIWESCAMSAKQVQNFGMSELDSWLKVSVRGTGLKADESSAKYDGTYAKGSCTKGSVNATLDLAARNIHPHPNEEIFVRFVRDLGVNEFGVARGYDFAFFGDAAEASAGTCSPSPAQRVASALGFTRESARGKVASNKNGLVITTASFAVLVIALAASKGKSAVKKGYNSDMNLLVSGEAQPLLCRAS